jgi:cation/acetate symporter
LSTTGILAASSVGDPAVNITIFAFFVIVTLIIVVTAAGSNSSTSDYYAGGRNFKGWMNGIAIGGDYLSAASFLGIGGLIALDGYDGFLYSIGFLVGWLLVLMLMAAPLRNTGRYTTADVMDLRLRDTRVRGAAAISTMVIILFYLLAQMAGAGALVSLLLGVSGSAGQLVVIVVVGLAMLFYVLLGGMKGTTWVQIIKAGLLSIGTVIMTVWILGEVGFNFSSLLRNAVAVSPHGKSLLAPGLLYGGGLSAHLNFVSLALALVLGTAGLPHLIMRLYTVPDATEARRSVVWTVWLVGGFYLCTLVLGFGAAWLVGSKQILSSPGGSDSAIPLLAYHLGGTLLMGAVAAVAFATILAVVAGLTITASASFAHDVYSGIFRGGNADSRDEVRVARRAAIVVGIVAVIGGYVARNVDVAFLVALAFAVAASANLPSIIYSLFWKRFTSRGALWSIYGGLISSVGLILFSPVVSGSTNPASPSLITDPHVNFAIFPLSNPGIVSIPLAFFLGWLGSVTDAEPANHARFARIQVRALTGVGAERSSKG